MPSSDTYFKKGTSGNPAGSSKKAHERCRVRQEIEAMIGRKAYQKIKVLNKDEVSAWFSHILSMDYETATKIMSEHSNKVPMLVKGYLLAIQDDMKKTRRDTRTLGNILQFLYGEKHEVTGKDGTPLVAPRTISKDEFKEIFNDIQKEVM